MKNILLFLFLLFSTHLFCQSQLEDTDKKIRIGFSFSPDFNYTIFKINTASHIKESYRRNHSGKFGMTAGININIRINKNIEFETGLQHSTQGFKYILEYEGDLPSAESIINAPETFEPQVIPYNYANITNHHFIDIPVKFNFLSKENKVRFVGSLGFDTNFYLASSSRKRFEALITGFNDYTTRNLDSDDPFIDITPTASIGLDYAINNKINMRFEPTFRYSLGIKHSNHSRFFSMGLNTKFYFDFWK